MNANQKIAEIIKEQREELLTLTDRVTLKQMVEELESVVSRNGDYCVECGRTSSDDTIFNCDIGDSDKAAAM